MPNLILIPKMQWWMAPGVAPVVAYQAKGAASLATSYVNLVNPGIYDATPGYAPAWDAVNGWISDGTKWLSTGYTPPTTSGGLQTISAMIRFSNFSGNGNFVIFGEGVGANWFFINPNNSSAVNYACGGQMSVAPGLLTGTLGIAGNKAYRNGTQESGSIGASTQYAYPIYLFAYNGGSGGSYRSTCNIQAFAIYNTVLTAAQMSALNAAMAAL